MILYQFRKKIEKLINSSELPIDAVYFVLKDVMQEITILYQNASIEEDKEQIKERQDNKKE